MDKITTWLEALGLSEYGPRLTENNIDLVILGELSHRDLEELGISSLGHRRKLLRAISTAGLTKVSTPLNSARRRRCSLNSSVDAGNLYVGAGIPKLV